MKSKSPFLYYLGLFLIAAIWGSTFVVLKDALETVDTFVLITVRFTIASVCLLVWIWIMKLNPTSFIKAGIITGVVQFLTYAPQTIGLKYTSPSNSAFITGLFIAFVPIANLLMYKKKPRIIEMIAVLIALSGLWILTGGVQNLNIGDLITVVTAAAIGFYMVMSADAIKKGADPIVLTFHQLVVTAIIAFILSVAHKEDYSAVTFHTVTLVSYLGIFGSFVAYVIQNISLKKVEPVLASIIVSLEPFFALTFAVLFKYEEFVLSKFVGGGIVLLAIILPELWNQLSSKLVPSSTS